MKQIQEGVNTQDNLGILYTHNINYIRKIAKKYSGYADIEDLIQEAYFGLYEAARRYENTAGILFITYASFWIKQSITRYIENNGRCIRIPSGLQARIYQYKRIYTTYEMQLGRKPTDHELCRYLGVNKGILVAIKKACQYDNIQSMDEYVPGADEVLLSECVPDKSIDLANDVINEMIESRLNNELWQIVRNNTSPEENTVITSRFRKSLSLEETGRSIGKSKDMTRNVELKALRKLRSPKIRRILEEKYEVNYARAYNGSLTDFKNRWSSIVEDIAIRNLDCTAADFSAQPNYKNNLKLPQN